MGSDFCKNCGFDATANMMMPLFVASTTRRRLFWLAAAWLVAFVLIPSYTLSHLQALEIPAIIGGALAAGASIVTLLLRTPYSFEFFEEFVRVAYPSSFARMTKKRIPYSSIDEFVCVRGKGRRRKREASTTYEFSVSGREGSKFVVRDVTSCAGVDLSQWIKGRIAVPVKERTE